MLNRIVGWVKSMRSYIKVSLPFAALQIQTYIQNKMHLTVRRLSFLFWSAKTTQQIKHRVESIIPPHFFPAFRASSGSMRVPWTCNVRFVSKYYKRDKQGSKQKRKDHTTVYIHNITWIHGAPHHTTPQPNSFFFFFFLLINAFDVHHNS